MPTYKYRLASGKLKRRVCGLELHRILTEELLASESVRKARSAGKLSWVIERPTPIPDVDGWQSAAVSGAVIRTARRWPYDPHLKTASMQPLLAGFIMIRC